MKRHHAFQAGDHLLQESEALRRDLRPERRHSGQAVPWVRDALNQAVFHGVAARYEDNRNSLRGLFCGDGNSGRECDKQVSAALLELRRCLLNGVTVSAALPYQEANRIARSVRLKHLPQSIETDTIRSALQKDGDHLRPLLSQRRYPPRSREGPKHAEECAPPHSITSSARAR